MPYETPAHTEEVFVSYQSFHHVNSKIMKFFDSLGFGEKKVEECPSTLKNRLRHFFTPPLYVVKTVTDINGEITLVKVRRGKQVQEYHRTNRNATETFSYPKGDLHGLFPTLQDFVSFAKGKSVLDVGCGGGAMVAELRQKGVEAYGMDLCLSPESENSSLFVEGDAFVSPFMNNSFDVLISIWSVFSYEPLNRLRPLLDEAFRILKPDGILILSPVMSEEKLLLLQRWSKLVGANILIDKKTHAILIKK